MIEPTFPIPVKFELDETAKQLGFMTSGSHGFRIWFLWRAAQLHICEGFTYKIKGVLRYRDISRQDLHDAFMQYSWPGVPISEFEQWYAWALPYIIGDIPLATIQMRESPQPELFDTPVVDLEPIPDEYADLPEWIWEHLKPAEWAEFKDWTHTPEGGEIANKFMRLALQMKRRGWKTFAAEAIVNQIRWQHALEHGPDVDGYKINNNWKRRLAIWAMTRAKDLLGFFQLRNEKVEASNE